MSHQICSCEPVCYINSYTLFIHECLLLIPINILIFMHFANGPSVCLLWKPFLWMAGGLIDLHYHILLLNLEGHMHKNRWWPINLQPPCRSGAVPARRISKFMLLKNLFFPPQSVAWSCGRVSAVCQQDYLTAGHTTSQGLLFISRRWARCTRSFAEMLFILKHSRRAQMFSCKTSAYFVSSTLVCETLGPKHWSDYQIYFPCMHCYLSHHKRGHCEMKLWRLNFCNMWIFLRFVSGSSKIRTTLHFIPNNGQDERVRMCCYLGRFFIMSFWHERWGETP